MLSIFVYIVPAVLIRYLLLGRPMQSGAAVGLSLLLFFVLFVVSIFLRKSMGDSMLGGSLPWVLIASVWSYFILRAGSGASDSPYSTVDSTLKEPKPASSADKAQKASPSKREDAKTPTSNPIKKQKDKAPYKPKEIPMNSAHDDEKFYEQVATELQEGNTRQGLWLKAETKAGGDNEKARLLYVEWRVEQLTKEADKANQAKAWNELIEAEAQARGERDLEEERITKEAEAQNYKEQQAEQIDSTCEKDRKPKSEKMLAKGEGIIKSRMRLDLECEAERTVNILLRLLNHGYIWKRKEHFIYNDVWSIKKESSVKWIDFFNIDELKEWADKNLPK